MISLLCPTRGRPRLVRKMLWDAAELATSRFNAVFYVDDDDGATVTELYAIHHPRVYITHVGAARYAVPMSDMWNHCADMALDVADFDAAFIASSRTLAITGTHVSTDGTYAAVRQAIAWAKAGDTRVVLDIDYRPVLWGLVSAGSGVPPRTAV